MDETLGQRIKQLRLGRGMTQEELARLMGGPNRGQISKWESDTDTPSLNNLQGLAKALNVTIDELVNDEAPAKSGQRVEVKVEVIGLEKLERLRKLLTDISKLADIDISISAHAERR